MFEDHYCNLPKQEEDVVKQFIDRGLFISLRRKCRNLCMVSLSHPLTAAMFKSHAAWRNEKIKHIVHHYFIIHPLSMFSLYWEFFMFFIYSTQFIIAPLTAASRIKAMDPDVYMIKFIVDVIQVADIIKLFFTGYIDNDRSKVILDQGKIAQHYILTYFFFDLLSSVHSYLYIIRYHEHFHGTTMLPERLLVVTRILNRVKVVRVPRWLHILELYREYMGYSSYVFKAIKVVLIFLVVTLWCFTINFFVENYVMHYMTHPDEVAYDLYELYYTATAGLLVVGFGDRQLVVIGQYITDLIFLCFGFALQLFLYAQILQVWAKYASAEDKHHYLNKQFKEYMKYKELPVPLRGKISTYFDFKFHKQFFKESDIHNMVSPLLKQEILLHVTKNHIERVDFFRQIPENVLIKVVTQMKTEIYLPDDVIISAGSSGNCMFFICSGTVAVYTPLGREICHLEDGAHFGEIALIFNETRVASVIAVTPTEVFMLKRNDFQKTIEPFPQLQEQLVALATERLHNTVHESDI